MFRYSSSPISYDIIKVTPSYIDGVVRERPTRNSDPEKLELLHVQSKRKSEERPPDREP